MTDRTITISIVDGALSLPDRSEATADDTVTWAVRTNPGIRWLVSFKPGAPFTVEGGPDGTPTSAPKSLEVRNGQRIRVPPGRKGERFEYRVAVASGDGIYGIFDCPTIIIT